MTEFADGTGQEQRTGYGRAIRFGVVGLGLMGERHCQVISEVPGALLTGVCDHNLTVAQRTAETFGGRTFGSYDEMLADEGIDAVVICLPSGLHGKFGVQAAEAGKHVVVEKPIDSRSDEARKLIDACETAGVQCAIISQNRYSPGIAAMKSAVCGGLMGKPVLARATVKWFRHDEYYTDSPWRGRHAGEYGGVLINQAVHSIDTLQWLFGEPSAVAGFTHCSREQVMETEDTAVAIFQWQGGLVATLEASTSAAPGFDEAYEVHSTIASIRVEKGHVVYWYHRDGADIPIAEPENSHGFLTGKLALFARQYNNIIATIRGEATLDVPARDALAVVQTIEKIYGACSC